MRILGYIEHPTLKITIFQMDDKLSLKFESGLYEQTYKFRGSNEINNLEHIKSLVDDSFIEKVMLDLAQMHRTKMEALSRYLPEERENEFEEII